MSQKKYDIFLCSKSVKKEVLNRIEKFNLNTYKLCERAGVPYNQFQAWCNDTDPRHRGSQIINHEGLLAICEVVGIEPRVLIVLKKDFTPDPSLKMGREKWHKQ